MAKSKEITTAKRGKAEFNLVGRAKVSDFTFKTDIESEKSDWVYNQLNLGVDCGSCGVIYADLMGGYGSDRENFVYVHGTKKNENGNTVDDFDNRFTIAWEDRLDEDNFENIGERCFLTVGVEKDTKDKTVYKKFLSPYDAIEYLSECLEDGTVVNVKGNIKYQLYNDTYTIKKEITSIALSKAEEKDFRATFTQTLLVDSDCVGKRDKETNTVPLTARIIDFSKEFDGKKIVKTVNGKKKEGCNIPIVKIFDIPMEDEEKTKKLLKLFKTKSGKITEITVDGLFSKGEINTTEVTSDDIPEDIKELMEMGLIDEEEVMSKIALANGGKKPEKMIIKAPHINMIQSGENRLPSLARETDKYDEDDVNPLLMIENQGAVLGESEDSTTDDSEVVDTDKLIDDVLNEDDDDDDWLSNL